jgi:arabinofuranosyltransferase
LTLVAGIGLLPFVHRFGTRRVPRAMGIALSAGITLQLAYVVWIGGDYMTGRFFACSFLVALVGLVSQLEVSPRMLGGAGLAALLVGWLSPGAPLLTGRDFAVEQPNRHGIGDQRGIFFQTSSLHRWLARSSQDVFPDYRWTRAGRNFARSDDLVLVRANVGFMGHGAGTQKIIIDRLGLTDPLLARLPSMQIWRIGHFPRRIPDGYPESVESGESRIVDPGVRAFHEKLELITQSDLLAAGRLAAIVGMNLGLYDHLLEGEQ